MNISSWKILRFLRGRSRWIGRWIHALLLAQLRANHPGPKVMANGIPKAGTHLLMRCLSLLPEMKETGLQVNGYKMTVNQINKTMRWVRGGSFLWGHLPFDTAVAELLHSLDMKHILIIRDPRDVVVSHFNYVTYKYVPHHLHKYYRALGNDFERLMASIKGVDARFSRTDQGLPNISQRFKSFLKWKDHSCLIVRFENLVGDSGGGKSSLQFQEINRIVEWMGMDLDDESVHRIGQQIYNRKSNTFRKGTVGDWRNHFTEAHKDAFKELAGDLLIELEYEVDCNW